MENKNEDITTPVKVRKQTTTDSQKKALKKYYEKNKNNEELKIIPYTATSLSVVGRFIFMFLLYKNKSTNSLSLIFCILSIFSSGMWIYYSMQSNDTPMVVRSSIEISLLSLSAVYIVRNKVRQYYETLQVLPGG